MHTLGLMIIAFITNILKQMQIRMMLGDFLYALKTSRL